MRSTISWGSENSRSGLVWTVYLVAPDTGSQEKRGIWGAWNIASGFGPIGSGARSLRRSKDEIVQSPVVPPDLARTRHQTVPLGSSSVGT